MSLQSFVKRLSFFSIHYFDQLIYDYEIYTSQFLLLNILTHHKVNYFIAKQAFEALIFTQFLSITYLILLYLALFCIHLVQIQAFSANFIIDIQFILYNSYH